MLYIVISVIHFLTIIYNIYFIWPCDITQRCDTIRFEINHDFIANKQTVRGIKVHWQDKDLIVKMHIIQEVNAFEKGLKIKFKLQSNNGTCSYIYRTFLHRFKREYFISLLIVIIKIMLMLKTDTICIDIWSSSSVFYFMIWIYLISRTFAK